MEESASRYSDFHTIDWLRDIARDRIRHRSIIKKRTGSVCDKSKSLLDAASGWLIVFLIGVSVGVIAGKWIIRTWRWLLALFSVANQYFFIIFYFVLI